MDAMGGKLRDRSQPWQEPLMPSEVYVDVAAPSSSDDGYPWALQSWDRRRRMWRWRAVGLVPLRRQSGDLRTHAKALRLRAAVRYVWVRHWTPGQDCAGARGWRGCIDTQKTVGPLRP